MVHDEMVTVPPETWTPPPFPIHGRYPGYPELLEYPALFPLMVHDEMATVPPLTQTPPPPSCKYPLVMLSPISCTTPDEPGLMFSTRRGLPELLWASSTTEPATAASRTTLLLTLSSALRT